MKIYKKDDLIIGIDSRNNYIVKNHNDFYKLTEHDFLNIFGETKLDFQHEIKDSPILCISMIVTIIITLILYFQNNTYVILDDNIIWANIILIINIILHELGHILCLKLFCPKSKVKMGFKFYFIYPAFYVDTSNTYLLPKYKRISVFLAGSFANCIFLLASCFLLPSIAKYNYLIVSTILINFLPIIKSDGYYAIISFFNKYNMCKSKTKNFVEDLIRGLFMFAVLNFVSYLDINI